MRITFRVVRLNELFTYNGNLYQKVSTRTARLIENGRVFYIEQLADCTV